MWQGQWTPVVYRFTSNWKELKTLLKTLLLTLQHLQQLAHELLTNLVGTTVFYFTDNLVTYWINQSGSSPVPLLHDLIWDIKCLELLLGIRLCVVITSLGWS
jgi:hypothetical protein